MAEDGLTEGTIWVLAHWLLPAKASKEDALDLISKAQQQFMTGLELKESTDW